MFMKQVLSMFCMVGLLSACVSSKRDDAFQQEQIIDHHTSQNSLDWKGVYSGSFPCDNCDEIRIVVVLADSTYTMRTYYVNEDVNPRLSSGAFSWTSDGSTITLHETKSKPLQFKVGEHRLIALQVPEDIQDSRIDSNIELKQLSYGLLDTTWELTEFNGKKEETIPDRKVRSITFTSAEGRYYGFGGCNNFKGDFFATDSLLYLSAPGSTKMRCPRGDEENQMLKALENVTSYALKDETLEVFQASKVVARFKQKHVLE